MRRAVAAEIQTAREADLNCETYADPAALARQCDLLLVLANGKIADYGERDEILAGSAYREIVLNRTEFGGDFTPGGVPQISGPRRE